MIVLSHTTVNELATKPNFYTALMASKTHTGHTVLSFMGLDTLSKYSRKVGHRQGIDVRP